MSTLKKVNFSFGFCFGWRSLKLTISWLFFSIDDTAKIYEFSFYVASFVLPAIHPIKTNFYPYHSFSRNRVFSFVSWSVSTVVIDWLQKRKFVMTETEAYGYALIGFIDKKCREKFKIFVLCGIIRLLNKNKFLLIS